MKKNPLTLFISYSHKDREFLNELIKHLAVLESNGVLEKWSDLELVAGDEIDTEILNRLKSCDLVAFLVSPDFLNSWNCYEVELKSTLERLENHNVRIIPIIVRTCLWEDTELKKYKAATTDGHPIVKSENQDDAWVEVARSIKFAADRFLETRNKIGSEDSITVPKELSSNFLEYLQDTEIKFQHRHKETITLFDIYIFPDLKNLKQGYEEYQEVKNAEELIDVVINQDNLLILGSEQSGKTSLSKMMFWKLYNMDQHPIFCNGCEIDTTDINSLIKRKLSDQYATLDSKSYLEKSLHKVLLIDDFDQIRINSRFQSKFISNALSVFDSIILFADANLKFDEQEIIKYSDYAQFQILPFGNLRRNLLIEKWNSLGKEETIDIVELHNTTDAVTHHVNSIIRKNIVPPKPIYILTIIQLLDTTRSSDFSLTSYGHCYQSLIQESLSRVRINPRDFDLYINYLSELAFDMFNTDAQTYSRKKLLNFQHGYSKKYVLQSHDSVISSLKSSGIIRDDNETIRFSYKYVYYFYVAKYLADHIESERCQKQIESLCNNLHLEKNANILIFLVHHTKNQNVIDEILVNAYVVFDGFSEAKLNTSETKYLLDYLAAIPKLILEQKDIDKERKKRLKNRDYSEGIQLDDHVHSEDSGDVDSDTNEMLVEINRSVRFVELIGQILKNRYGSLTRPQLVELGSTAYSSGLKFLNFFLTAAKEEQNHVLQFIQKVLIENTELSDEEVAKEARKIFLMLCYHVSYSVIKKIANSVGTEKLIPIYDELCGIHQNSPAYKLINIAIKLEFTKVIPKSDIENLFSELHGNPIAQRLLQEIVIQHLYLNQVEYKDRQWISSKLHLGMKDQRKIQNLSVTKQ